MFIVPKRKCNGYVLTDVIPFLAFLTQPVETILHNKKNLHSLFQKRFFKS